MVTNDQVNLRPRVHNDQVPLCDKGVMFRFLQVDHLNGFFNTNTPGHINKKPVAGKRTV